MADDWLGSASTIVSLLPPDRAIDLAGAETLLRLAISLRVRGHAFLELELSEDGLRLFAPGRLPAVGSGGGLP